MDHGARRGEQGIRLVRTRNYVGHRTALNVSWLLFRELGLANEFLRTFPRFDVPNRREGLERHGRELAQKVDQAFAARWFQHRQISRRTKTSGITPSIGGRGRREAGGPRSSRELQFADSLRTDWMTVMGE